MSSITKIISRCIKGDEAACKKLYDKFLPYSYGICIRYGVPKSEIKDHLQIIFSATFKSLTNFDASKASFKTWFTHVCINKILEQRRNKGRQLEYDELPEYGSSISFNDANFIEGNLDKEYVLRILNKMPKQYQSVFNLFIVDGYTHKEIAKKLSITEGSSRAILKRGRDWAKSALSNFLQTH